jgi:arylsulfatase A-like enzyme
MHHMLHVERGETNLLAELRKAGYFVWWGGKNDLVPGQHGYDAFCDVKYDPPGEQSPLWKSDHEQEWRGEPGSDTYYSFYVGRLPQTGKVPATEERCYYDRDWAMVNGAVDFIRSYDGEQPFFLFLPLTYPHPPYAVEDPWYSLIDRSALPARAPSPEGWGGKPSLLAWIHRRQNLSSWTEERWAELRATYYGMCSRVDHQVGLVIDALREAGLYDDTAFFLFSDHGDFTGDYGLVEKTQNTFEDCLTRVPLVVKPPREAAGGSGVSDALAELVDFPATVYDLCGIEPSYTHFGRSLLPLLRGEKKEHRDAVFCEGGRLRDEPHCEERESTSSQNPAGLYFPRLEAQGSKGPEHGKAVMCRDRRYKYVLRLYEKDELYDLEGDPQELQNLIDSPEHGNTAHRLKDRMLRWFVETGDVVPFQTDSRW